MTDMSVAQSKQHTSKTASDAFGPLEQEALDTLAFWTGKAGRAIDPRAALDAAKYVLDKVHGKTPEQSSGQEPLWMKVVRKSLKVDGVPAEDLPGMKQATGEVSGEVEETTFEFIWPPQP